MRLKKGTIKAHRIKRTLIISVNYFFLQINKA